MVEHINYINQDQVQVQGQGQVQNNQPLQNNGIVSSPDTTEDLDELKDLNRIEKTSDLVVDNTQQDFETVQRTQQISNINNSFDIINNTQSSFIQPVQYQQMDFQQQNEQVVVNNKSENNGVSSQNDVEKMKFLYEVANILKDKWYRIRSKEMSQYTKERDYYHFLTKHGGYHNIKPEYKEKRKKKEEILKTNIIKTVMLFLDFKSKVKAFIEEDGGNDDILREVLGFDSSILETHKPPSFLNIENVRNEAFTDLMANKTPREVELELESIRLKEREKEMKKKNKKDKNKSDKKPKKNIDSDNERAGIRKDTLNSIHQDD